MSDGRRGCSYSALGCGCFIGFTLGALLAAGGAGAWWYIYQQAVLDPLMNLDIPDGPLTIDQTEGQIDKLAQDFIASSDNRGSAAFVNRSRWQVQR